MAACCRTFAHNPPLFQESTRKNFEKLSVRGPMKRLKLLLVVLLSVFTLQSLTFSAPDDEPFDPNTNVMSMLRAQQNEDWDLYERLVRTWNYHWQQAENEAHYRLGENFETYGDFQSLWNHARKQKTLGIMQENGFMLRDDVLRAVMDEVAPNPRNNRFATIIYDQLWMRGSSSIPLIEGWFSRHDHPLMPEDIAHLVTDYV